MGADVLIDVSGILYSMLKEKQYVWRRYVYKSNSWVETWNAFVSRQRLTRSSSLSWDKFLRALKIKLAKQPRGGSDEWLEKRRCISAEAEYFPSVCKWILSLFPLAAQHKCFVAIPSWEFSSQLWLILQRNRHPLSLPWLDSMLYAMNMAYAGKYHWK